MRSQYAQPGDDASEIYAKVARKARQLQLQHVAVVTTLVDPDSCIVFDVHG